jgi:hypothetical protein
MILSLKSPKATRLYPDQCSFENITKPNAASRLGAHDEFEPNLFETAI